MSSSFNYVLLSFKVKKSTVFLFLILLFISLPSCIIPTYIGNSSLQEIEKKEVNKKISNVLIVGAGSTASRVFLENFSGELIKYFKKQNMPCDFIYVGKIPKQSHLQINKIVTTKYDNYLVLYPMDTSQTNLHKQVAIFATPIGGGYAASGWVFGNQYKEDYYVELFGYDKNQLEKIWQGELKVDFDFSNPTMYKKIAYKLFNKLIKK